MKSVMISIQPYWVFLIIAKVMGWDISKEKTVEVRKNYPKDENWNKVVKIYCSKDKKSFAKIPVEYQPLMERFLGNVIGEFVCDRITPTTKDHIKDIAQASCLTIPEMWEYGRKSSAYDLFGWHISDLVIYDDPKKLYEFHKCGALSMEELDEQLCQYCRRTDYGEHRSSSTPNGYWSCEGKWCDEAYTEYLDSEYLLTRPPQSWCYVEG